MHLATMLELSGRRQVSNLLTWVLCHTTFMRKTHSPGNPLGWPSKSLATHSDTQRSDTRTCEDAYLCACLVL